ncbi:MAG TPA: choice-of-anchor D domain-containing protein [Terriglobia bacterium]|nr:choice-of-anchor D domain-containing protein [Terriglobia bacterium]
MTSIIVPLHAQNKPVPLIELPLVPASIRPGSAAFTLTINGAGFVSGSTAYWNGSARATTFVNGTQVKATINASDIASAQTASVTVLNPSPGGGYSNTAFLGVTNPASAVSLSGTTNAAGDSPVSVATGDFNGDHIEDLAVANDVDNTVSILLGNGNGTFQSHVDYATSYGPAEVAVGDFNRDGFLDLAVVNAGENSSGQSANSVSILLGDGDGTFRAHVDYPTGRIPVAAAVGDFNGDGYLDLAVVAQYDAAVSILLGNGDGTFQSETEYAAGGQPTAIVVSDFNRDGFLDLGVANFDVGTVSILLGNGNGTFQTATEYSATEDPYSLVAADFNGDGIPDLAVAEFGSSAVSILLGNGDGSFQNQVLYTTGSYPEAITSADFNGDGILDLALATDDAMGSVTVMLGNGNGTFQSFLDFSAGALPVSVAAADFNNDGLMDAVTADVNSDAISALLSGELGYAPTSLNFGSISVGTTSSPRTVTLTNSGVKVLTISSIATGAPFTETNTCGSSLNAGASCTVNVTFTPVSTGSSNGSLIITDSATGSPQTVSLTGSGTGATVTFSPTSLDFGDQQVNTSSALQTVTMTNNGTTTLDITSITATGDYAITGDTCGSTLAASSNCAFNVKFTPTQAGTRTGDISVADSGYGSPQTVSLTGTGIQGVATLSPASLTFGVQLLNTSSTSQTVTLTNNGTASINIISIQSPKSFPQTNNCGTTVGVGADCSITITFTPASIGSLSGNISISDNAAGSPQKVSVSGTATEVSLSPTSLNFGSVTLGTTSSTMTVTLTNVGSSSLNVTKISMTGANSTEFAQTNTCGSSVGAGASCTVNVTFTPAGTGTRTASLSVNDSGGASPQTVSLSGTGQAAGNGPMASFNPGSVSFGNQNYKTKSKVTKVTLTSTGSQSLTITGIAASGDYAQTNTCPSSLSPGAICTISTSFTPTIVGADNGSLSVTDNASGSPQTVSLTGTGVGAVASVSPGTLTYGVQLIGTSSTAQVVTLTNTGNASLIITGITPSSNFSETNNCGSSLAAGADCIINISFAPTKAGSLSGNVAVNDNSTGNGTQKIAVSGTGTAMEISPTSLNFGSVSVGTTSASEAVSVTNVSSSSVNMNSYSFSGTDPKDFGQNNNCGSSLAAGTTCTLDVTFTPGASGARSATLNIYDAGGASPQTVALSGAGD